MSDPTDPSPQSSSLIIVRDADDELRIVARDGEPVDWRRLSNAFRGRQLHAIRTRALAGLSGDTRDTSVVQVDAARGRPATTVMVSVDEGVPPRPRAIGTWTWESFDPDAPPTLHLSPSALDLLGVAHEQRDRSVYGPADFCTRLPRLGDIVSELDFVYDAPHGASRVVSTPIEHSDGTSHTLWCAELVTEGDVRTVHGSCWLSEDDDAYARSRDTADSRLSDFLAHASGQLMFIGDIRFPRSPCLLKWLSPYPETVGHGIGTGQTSEVHPDDLGRVIEYISELRDSRGSTGVKELPDIRTRRAGGGWLLSTGIVRLLDPEHMPNLVVVLVTSLE